MKKLLRSRRDALGSLADPSQILSTKTGRASGRTARKSLIINDQILHPPTQIVRKCPVLHFYPTHPEPIRGNPNLRAETPRASGRTRVANRNGHAGLNGRCNTPQSLHRVALCCSVLHRVAPKNLSDLKCNTFTFPAERAGTAGMRPCELDLTFVPIPA